MSSIIIEVNKSSFSPQYSITRQRFDYFHFQTGFRKEIIDYIIMVSIFLVANAKL